MSPRRAASLALVAFAALLVAQPAMAAQVDPRNQEEQPDQGKGAMPEHPENVNARTGTLTVAPNLVEAGDLVTATFHPLPGSVSWEILAPKGAKCAGGHTAPSAEQLKHLPVTAVGGASSCTWRVGSTNRRWQVVEVSIAGPCGDTEAVRAGKAEYAICAGGHSNDYYMATGKDDPHIHGTLRDGAGKPVPGVEMDMKVDGDARPRSSVTDAIGHYGFWLPDGAFTITPSKFKNDQLGIYGPDDFSPQQASGTAHGNQVIDFTVRGRQLSGKVSDGTKPLAGVTLQTDTRRGHLVAVTGSDGGYSFTLPTGRYSVRVTSPAPPDPDRANRFLGAAYKCVSSMARPDGLTCEVDLSSDRAGVNFSTDTDLNVAIVIDGKEDFVGRHMVTITVTDSGGNPVGEQLVKISPQSIASPRVLLEGMDGRRIYPVEAPAVGAPPATDSVTLQTDDSGKIQLAAWVGTQSGKWSVTAEAVDAKGKTKTNAKKEKATASMDLPADGKPFPADDALKNGIVSALKAGIPHPASTTEGINGQDPIGALGPVLDALAPKAKEIGISVSPLHSADGRSAGILLLDRNPSDAVLKEVGAFLATPGAPAPSGTNHVLDIGELVAGAGKPGVSTWDQIPINLKATLKDWPPAAGGAPRSRPVAGDPTATGDAQQLTGFGWPDPSPQVGLLDAAAGRQSTTFQVSRPRDAPVRLEFATASGARVGDVHGTVNQVAGARIVTDDSRNLVTYSLPHQTFTATISGTGSGTAPVTVTGGRWNEAAKLFQVPARNGTDGEMELGSGGTVGGMTYGGRSVPLTPGAPMKVTGLPRSEPAGAIRRYDVRVTDAGGSPLPDATVKVEAPGYLATATSDAGGKATVPILGPASGELVTTVSAPAHAPSTAKIASAPAVLPPVDAAARRYIGPEQTVYMPRRPGSPLAVVELAATLFVSALGIGFLRSRPG